GISGNEHQFRPATFHNSIEGCEQGLDLLRSPIQFLRDQKPVWSVVFAKREFLNSVGTSSFLRQGFGGHACSSVFPCNKAAPKIALNARRCLIAFLGRLG